MFARAVIVAVLCVGTGAVVQRAAIREPHVSRAPLGEMPLQIDEWRGHDAAPLADDVVATLGVDDYINRRYERHGVPVSMYIGYYANQRSGDTIHSPQNCLPGAGWLPVASGRQRIALGSSSVEVTRYEIVKGPRSPGGAVLVSGPRPHRRRRVRQQGVADARRGALRTVERRAGAA